MFNGAWQWQTVADNLEAIDFVYLDGNGVPLDPTTATNLPLIRSVQITFLAITTRQTRDYTNTQTYENQMDPGNPAEVAFYWSFTASGDNFRRRLLTTEIFCRNMGMK
jgi:type IV pilus assembly protein PilW